MSRVAKAPITIPEGVNITQEDGLLSVKGKLGEMTMHVNSLVQISNNDNVLTFEPNQVSKKLEKSAWAQAGTARANTANLIKGVTDGWEKKLTLIGWKILKTGASHVKFGGGIEFQPGMTKRENITLLIALRKPKFKLAVM